MIKNLNWREKPMDMAMAMGMAPSDEDMVSLLSQFELLHKSYKDAALDIRTLKAKLSLETQKREAAEASSHGIEQERQRLLKAQRETFSKMVQELEFRSKFEDMLKNYDSLKQRLAGRENEHEKILSAIREENAAEISALKNQIRQIQEELTLRDAAVAHLEQELSCLQSTMKELQQSSEKALQDEASKCMPDQLELCDMKHKLELLAQEKNKLEDRFLQEKNMLQEQLQSVEKQLMTERADSEKKLRESSFNRHAEVYKQKIMRLRKENEDLRLQLHGVAHH